MRPATKKRAEALELQLRRHSDWSRAVSAGQRNVDQLLRALVPLFLAETVQTVGGGPVRITSGDISRFWSAFGVWLSPSNAAKALLWHIGYSRHTRRGRRITPNGVRYVRAAFPRPLDRSGE